VTGVEESVGKKRKRRWLGEEKRVELGIEEEVEVYQRAVRTWRQKWRESG